MYGSDMDRVFYSYDITLLHDIDLYNSLWYTSWPKNEIHSLWHANEYSIFLCFDNIFIVYMLRFLLPFFVVNSYLFHEHNFNNRDSLYICFAAFFSNLWFPRHIFFWSFIFFKGTCIIWVLFLWPLKVSYRIVSHILILKKIILGIPIRYIIYLSFLLMSWFCHENQLPVINTCII